MVVKDTDDVFLINSDGIIIRINAGEVSRLRRTTQGVHIMKVKEDCNIITMAKAIREEDVEERMMEDTKKDSAEKEDDQISIDVKK
jgi:DNA gyrase subunit A